MSSFYNGTDKGAEGDPRSSIWVEDAQTSETRKTTTLKGDSSGTECDLFEDDDNTDTFNGGGVELVWDEEVTERCSNLEDDSEHALEVQTEKLQMTMSPSLSALAGILNEKTKKAEEKMRRGSIAILEESIAENDLTGEKYMPHGNTSTRNIRPKAHNAKSPNLVNIDDENLSDFNHKLSSLGKEQISVIEPDFLSTPIVQPMTPEFQKTYNNSSAQDWSVNSVTSRMKSSHSGSSDERPRAKSLTSTVETGTPATSKDSVDSIQANLERLNEQAKNSQRKRRSVFSFLRKITPNVNSTENVTSSRRQFSLPTSVTFSVTSPTDEPSRVFNRQERKSTTGSSLFSSFRRSRIESDSSVFISNEEFSKPLPLPKPRERNSGKSADKPTRTDGSNSKITKRYFNENTKSRETEKGVVDAPKPAGRFSNRPPPPPIEKLSAENLHPEDAWLKLPGNEGLFPKSLDPQEVDSIVSIERTRSQRSARNSTHSYRRSFTDISTHAQSEGMFIAEASDVLLSTPDLTKSPTGSILRNTGTFEPPELDKDNLNLVIDTNGASLGTGLENDSHPDEDNSFSVIQAKLNELTVDTYQDDEGYSSKNILTNPDSLDSKGTDTEFMDDIMEFANIIDFGDDLQLDLDLNNNDYEYKTLNPCNEYGSEKEKTPVNNSPQFYEPRQISIGGDLFQVPLTPGASYDEFESDTYPETDVEGADLYGTMSSMQPIDPYLPSASNTSRPYSMSFRGLGARQFNSSHDLSIFASSVDLTTTVGNKDECVRFSSKILLHETYSEEEYDRRPDIATCNQLTPQLGQLIREELNCIKSEMEVHEESRCYTHFL
ncbi:HBR549Cp [Eremothecium sinecaudum]|uniref:HBR549Cp n=1 Tax=Eremothecium sinecaudum TaxID=45286 RepID=A0A109UVR2_9SACH|nr:HBR549Cp [Eremothecium sinecaudum]AMD19450.1 HBR549Cp [Eremothecium sinecaudum]